MRTSTEKVGLENFFFGGGLEIFFLGGLEILRGKFQRIKVYLFFFNRSPVKLLFLYCKYFGNDRII